VTYVDALMSSDVVWSALMAAVTHAWLRKNARCRDKLTGEFVTVMFRRTYPASTVRPRIGAWTLVAYEFDDGRVGTAHGVDFLARFERSNPEQDSR
jgi:hypothetical protein